MTFDLFGDFNRWINAEMVKTFGVPSHLLQERPPLTARVLEAQMHELRAAPPQIIYTAAAFVATLERLFPISRHRSPRIRKKLIKRFGGEYRMEPAILRAGRVLFVHPIYREKIERAARSAA